MTTKQGNFNEHLTVATTLTVQGSVSAGATISEHGNLVVQGVLNGPVIVENGGSVTVQGTIAGDVHLRDGGLMMIAGVWAADLVEHDGHLGLAVGTVVGHQIMQDDGSFRDAEDGTKVSMTLDLDAYRFRAPDGSFVRANDLPRANS